MKHRTGGCFFIHVIIKKSNYMRSILLSFLFILGMALTNCNKDDDVYSIASSERKETLEEGTITNGRFQFSSKEALSETIERMKEKGEENLASRMERHYKSGFRSLKPAVDPSNESLMDQIGEEIRAKAQFRMLSKSETSIEEIIEQEQEFIPGSVFCRSSERRQRDYCEGFLI